jgi:hypothetical protein
LRTTYKGPDFIRRYHLNEKMSKANCRGLKIMCC